MSGEIIASNRSQLAEISLSDLLQIGVRSSISVPEKLAALLCSRYFSVTHFFLSNNMVHS